MDELSKEYVISFFDKNLMLHGDRPEAVRWSSAGQVMHYRAMLDIGDINGKRVLDYGCGKGDFYQFLKEQGLQVEYAGFDINEKLIALAEEKYPDADFRVFDIEKEELAEEFDYIILCGVFNLEVQGLDETIRNTLLKLFPHCRTGLAFNALSSHNPHRDFELHYTSPGEMLSFALSNLSPHVSLRHDRMAYDFTLFAYRERNQFPG
ncbi:MAG: class I SAM-dependent methyltransferase [Nitrospirota bacterium]